MSHISKAYAATSPDSGVAPFGIERRALRADDVAIDIDYCGVCHTDSHFVQNDWGMPETQEVLDARHPEHQRRLRADGER